MTTTRDLFVEWGTFSRDRDLWTFDNVESLLLPGTPFRCRSLTAEGANDHVREAIRRGLAVDVRTRA